MSGPAGADPPVTHPWDVTPEEARRIQEWLRPRVVREDRLPDEVRRVAGVDIGFEDDGRTARAAIVVLDYPGLQPLECRIGRAPANFPYVPGLLSFREVPAALAAWAQLRQLPDLILCDGQGYAHPRRFGLACHLGVLLDWPTIGVAKSRLIGTHIPLPEARGSQVPLCDGDEVIGCVLRTRRAVRPLYVSVGHRISLPTACDWVLRCAPRYRLPETTRWADRIASRRGRWTCRAGHVQEVPRIPLADAG